MSESFTSRKGYTPKLAMDFTSLMEKQAKPVYERLGIIFPVIASSAVNLIAVRHSVSLTEIAKGLVIPHQLASQRVKILLKLDIICAQKDELDRRKTNYQLTEFGLSQYALLQAYLASADEVFKELDTELGIDFTALLKRVNHCFKSKSLMQRMFGEGD